MDYKLSFLCTLVISFSLIESTVSLFSDVTSAVGFGGNIDGVTAAFGDFNADKKADIFVITKGKSSVEVYLWDTSKEEFQRSESAKIEVKTCSITNVIPGDFNGDGHLDVLVAYTQPRRKDETFVKVFLGKKSSFDEEITLQDTLKDQPAIIDFDGDLQPDLLGEKNSDTESSIYWWKYNHKKKSFEDKLISTKNQRPLSKPHSCGFLDLSGDYTPDIFIPTQTERASEGIIFEVWINKGGEFNVTSVSNKEYKPNFHFSKIGQSTFADLDGDGLADHLLPVYDKDGAKSEIRVYLSAEKKWVSILSNEKSQDFKWNFIPENFQDIIPFMTLRIGDYNLDGYPDAVAVVQEQKHSRKVVLLKNVECNGPTDCFHGRSFHIDHVISSIKNPLVVGFFDLYEDGILDLIVVSSNDSASSYQIHAIKNNVYSDTCFLKVIVLGGSCFSSCPSGVTPYGVNQAGPYVKYITTGPGGDSKQASATQLSQSSYFALQPPYTVFGLGRTPNFVEKLIISLPRSKNSPVRRHTWTSIIPNSQVIIIPHPPDEPDEWKSKLLVTPSRLVLLTGGALLATCVFIGAIVAVLHWKEKREDRREKQEAAHKFHFDAM